MNENGRYDVFYPLPINMTELPCTRGTVGAALGGGCAGSGGDGFTEGLGPWAIAVPGRGPRLLPGNGALGYGLAAGYPDPQTNIRYKENAFNVYPPSPFDPFVMSSLR